jgi:uncharacterized protein YcbX
MVNPSGALAGDRRFAMVDAGNAFINGKRYPQVNQIEARYSADLVQVFLSLSGLEGEDRFDLHATNRDLCLWLSDALGLKVALNQDRQNGFPDSNSSPGPTLISAGSYAQVGNWFPGIGPRALRRRFRANLEIDGVPPFWEDELVLGRHRRFAIGKVEFVATKLSDRCQVPAQDPDTGVVDHGFQNRFMQRRAASLPADVNPYTLSINTRAATAVGGVLQVGMRMEIL